MSLRPVGELSTVQRSFLDTDGRTGELFGSFDRRIAGDHETLPVMQQDAGEQDAEPGFAAQRPRRIAQQQVDVAETQRREALGGA